MMLYCVHIPVSSPSDDVHPFSEGLMNKMPQAGGKNPDRKVDLTDNTCGLSGSGKLLINSICRPLQPLQVFPNLRQQGT